MPVDPGPGYRRPKPKAQGKSSGRGRQPAPAFGLDRLHPNLKDPIPAAVAATRPEAVAGVDAARRETLRRQRLLFAQGYPIKIDGIWGPRAQTAWEHYREERRRKGTLALGMGPLKKDPKGKPVIRDDARPGVHVATDVEIMVSRKEKEAEAERVAVERRRVERERILREAKSLRQDPASARAYKFHEVAMVLLDKEAKLGIQTNAGARVFQEWARANGMNVKVTGRYDAQTHDALEKAYRNEVKKERRKSIRVIERDLYGPTGIQPGDKVDWLPYGRVPSASDLHDMIQSDSFQAHAILNALMQRAVTTGATFDSIRRSELMMRAVELQPFLRIGRPAWMRAGSGQGEGGNQLSYIAALLGVQVLAPTGTDPALLAKYGGMSPQEAQDSVYGNREWRIENQKRIGALQAEVRALASSSSPEEFKAKLAANLKAESMAFEAFQKRLAGESTSWWGKAIDTILLPGEYAATAGVFGAHTIDHYRRTYIPRGVIHSQDGWFSPRYEDATDPAPTWEDAEAYFGRAGDDYDGPQGKAALSDRLALELILDPLNFVAPFKYASTGLKALGVAKMGGYTLVGKKLVYTRGTWTKTGIAHALDEQIADLFRGDPLHESAVFRRAQGMGQRAAALKVEKMAAARVRIDQMTNHSFRPPKPPKNAKGETVKHDVEVRAPRRKTAAMIEKAQRDIINWLTTDEEFARLVEAMEREGVSLFVNFSRKQRSNVGASFRANMIEVYRVTTIHQVASRHARQRYEEMKAAFDAEYAAKHGRTNDLTQQEWDRLTLDEQLARSERNKAELAAFKKFERDTALALKREYSDIVEGAGVFLKGGFLSKGGKSVDKELLKTIEKSMRLRMDELDKGIIPALQNHLEELAERKGASLWDDDLLWAGRKGEAAETVRRLGRESFDEVNLKPAPNPQHGIEFSRAERDELVEAELRRREGRIWQKAERDVAGTPGAKLSDQKWILDALERERQEILTGWVKRGGKYVDTREEVMVSDLYMRHLTAAWGTDDNTGLAIWRGRTDATNAGEFIDQLAAFAEPPGMVKGGSTDAAMWKLAWNQGGMYQRRLPGAMRDYEQHGTRRFLGPDFSGIKFGTPEWDDKLREAEEQIARGDQLRDALTENAIGVRRAWDELMSGELRKDSAFWQALAHSQAWYARAAYLGLSGALNTWTFATLALRPGWMVRNVIDNVAKLLVVGVRDPRMFFLGGAKPGAMVASVFDMGLTQMRHMIVFLDQLFGTNAAEHWNRLESAIWTLGSDALKAIFTAHGVDVPEAVLEEARLDVFDRRMMNAFKPSADEDRAIELGLIDRPGQIDRGLDAAGKKYKSFRDGAFELMGNRPENYFKRVLYRFEFEAERKRLLDTGNFHLTAEVPNYRIADARERLALAEEDLAELNGRTGLAAHMTDAELAEARKVAEKKVASLRRSIGIFERKPLKEGRVWQIKPEEGPNHSFTYTTPDGVTRRGDIDINTDAMEEMLRQAGAPAGSKIEVKLVSNVTNLPHYMNGSWNSATNTGQLRISRHALADLRTQEDVDSFIRTAVSVWWHEARHGKQSTTQLGRKAMKFYGDRKDFWRGNGNRVYRSQLHEMDANFSAYLNSRRFEGFITLIDADTEVELIFPKAVDDVALDTAAHEHAWGKVEDTLFDYSKISVVEDNFRVFFPFIQFWRKNTNFWAQQFVSKPWLPLSVVKLDDERRDAHKDLPVWMRRYMHSEEISDAAARIPGLDTIVQHLIPENTQYDPFNLLSFAPFYRSLPKILDEMGALAGMEKGLAGRLKTTNPSLPGESEGHAIFGPMIDALSDYGLGLSPFMRKPLESAGIASERAWQFMFPQTALAVALTGKFWGESAALKLAGWESVWGHLPLGVSSDAIADNFDYYVEQFVAEQVARGEEPDFAAAEKAVRHWFLTQNVYAYFTGMYLRRARPEDIYLAQLAELPHEEVPEQYRTALKLWRMRGHDRLTFERYVQLAPMIEAYYRSSDWQTKVQLKRDYPEIVQYVDATWRGRPFSGKWTRDAQKYTQTAKFYEALEILDGVDAPRNVRDAAIDTFKTPELEEYWQSSGTPKQERETMIRAAAWEYHDDLQQGYWEIPDDDYAAKDGYLAEHPELVRHWNRNNDPADDYEAIIGGANAALRTQYFAIVKANGGGNKGFAAAAPLLKAFPFMFDGTKSEGRFNPETGEWKPGAGKGKGKNWSAERIAHYLRAKPHLSWFFGTYMKKVGEKAAWAWLNGSDSEKAKLILSYIRTYGKKSQKSIDYMKAAPWLKLYHEMSKDARRAWLEGDSEGAKIVLAWFEKYGSKGGETQYAKDYLAAKPALDAYFALPKAKRQEWLHSGTPEARKVLSFFKKYSKIRRFERSFAKKFPQLVGGTPEQRKRLEFWRQYFLLTPDKRPAFILEQAEAHGVFIYGEMGEEARHDREMEYNRRAVGLGASKKQSAYLYAKPLLDFYYSLPKEERALFARLNPEINEYLDKYAKTKLSGDKKLDAAIEGYFKLPPDSLARSRYLREHPQVQDWFDSKASPADAAMRNLLEQYFELSGDDRDEFAAKHPEIDVYFLERREKRSLEGNIYDAFDLADPRLRESFQSAEDVIRSADEMRRKLREAALNKFTPDSIESRRDRRTEPSPYL